MGIDIQLFRNSETVDIIRESQRRRCRDPKSVDDVLDADVNWRKLQFYSDSLKRLPNMCSKAVGERRRNKDPEGEDIPLPEEVLAGAREGKLTPELLKPLNIRQLMALSTLCQSKITEAHNAATDAAAKREALLSEIGNIVHESVAVGADEDKDNKIERIVGDCSVKEGVKLSHVDVMTKLGGMDCSKQVTQMAGGRAYVLRGPLVQLQLALLNYAMSFLVARGYTPFYPPFFLNKEAMGSVAQLNQFDEELYKVTGDGDDKYLIATSEMPICAYHSGKWYQDLKEPIKYAGMSSCFRKEAGSHGRDTLGIFRVHQFDKIEQFVVCSPQDSWKMLDTMIETSESFFKSLGIPYRVVNICSGALNNAAAKKFDLEGWFPGSGAFRELVSCSNCTDYQSRGVNCRYGTAGKGSTAVKEYVHMLNGTCCAITRTMCAICENFQTEEGVVVPEVLRPFMGGLEILKYADADKIPQ